MTDSLVTESTGETQQNAGVPWYVYALIINALLGVIMFEWAWVKTARSRAVPKQMPELDKVMSAFKRVDTERWSKWKFYPGAMLILVPRIVLQVVCGFLMVIFVNILLIGHDRTKPL